MVSAPRWSPDGTMIVYAAMDENAGLANPAHAIYTIRATGAARPARVPLRERFPSDPFWSTGSTFVYYWRGADLWSARQDGSEEKRIGTYPAYHIRPVLAAGGYLYYPKIGPPFSLMRISLDTGRDETVVEGLGSPYITASRKDIYFVAQSDGSLRALPFAGGPPRSVAAMPHEGSVQVFSGLAVSPDGTHVVWAVPGPHKWIYSWLATSGNNTQRIELPQRAVPDPADP